jgi:type I phosphodiesterase/nucleotide pyrophosphatase
MNARAEGVLGPERPGGQGLDADQEESGNRAILALLADPEVRGQVDLVITCRDSLYEVWSERGMVRFRRARRDGIVAFEVVERIGENPIERQDHTPIASCAEELAAASASGHATDDPNRAFIEPSQVSYPHAYERIAQLFDSPNAPDLVLSPRCYTFGLQAGQHGALDVVQSRAPLAFAGPGVRPGLYATAPRHVDIAPTICRLMRFPLIDGNDASGIMSSERGAQPDVYLKRQDGRVLEEIVEERVQGSEGPRVQGFQNPEVGKSGLLPSDPRTLAPSDPSSSHASSSPSDPRTLGPSDPSPSHPSSSPSDPRTLGPSDPSLVYLILFDGLSNSELQELIDRDDPSIANLRRILDRAARFRFGSTVNFPSITWPSHATILTGAWCGHHDIVNPTYYDRAARTPLAPQAEGMMTERYLGDGVETLYEAFHRVLGANAFTANIHEPQARGADHAALERRVIGPRDRLKALTADFVAEVNPRYLADGHENVHREGLLDSRGLAQALVLFDDPSHPPPLFTAHEFALTDGAGHDYGPHGEGLREAIAETDRRLGRVLDLLEAKGLFDSTLFVFTSDHGMAAQDVSLGAAPAWHPQRVGMKTVVGDPMIWLRDLRVEVERAPDGRTGRVTVLDNDVDGSGERPPIAGAEVLVHSHPDHVLARLATNEVGIAGFATPPDAASHTIVLSIHHSDFNPRHVRLDGTNLVVDLRRELYGLKK